MMIEKLIEDDRKIATNLPVYLYVSVRTQSIKKKKGVFFNQTEEHQNAMPKQFAFFGGEQAENCEMPFTSQ